MSFQFYYKTYKYKITIHQFYYLKREVISIHIGQCGVQLGNACWELYGVEHGILPNGQIETIQPCNVPTDSFTSFYQEVRTNKYVPRAVLVDFEPTVIGEIKLYLFICFKLK